MKIFLKKISLFLILMLAVFLTVDFVSAQQLDTGQQQVDETILLDDPDPRVVAARIVQIALGFLGILALALILYAGYMWMTSAGNADKIETAKNIIKNAVIGLLIILSAFGIVSFIISQLTGATTPGGGDGGGPGGGIGGGSGALGSCSLESVYPEPNQKEVPRNTSIIFTFRKEVDSSTVCNVSEGGQCDGENIRTDGRIKIYKSESDPENDANWVTDVSVYETDDHKTFVLVPDEYLGSSSEFIWYTVYLSNDIRERNEDEGMFTDCKADYYNWQFEVSDEIDLTPPRVKEKGVFPAPDGEKDNYSVTQEDQKATGTIEVLEQPGVYAPASVAGVTSVGDAPEAEAEADDGCSQDGTLTVAVKTDGVTAELSQDGTLLGEQTFNGTTVDFSGVLSLTVTEGNYSAGNSWEVEMDAVQQADTITLGSNVYTFVDDAAQDTHIEPGDNNQDTASNIASVIDLYSEINASANGSSVDIEAGEAGEAGNNIYLDSSDEDVLKITSMSGGQDKEETATVNDKPDQPRNSIIQINFNEAINPITVSGNAQELSDHIRVKCDDDDDCANDDYFFDCQGGGRCIKGEFLVSNQYSTVEFKSNNQCGTNACGQPIYCLPANSHPEVDLEAATLEECSGDSDCQAKAPYTDCSSEDSTVSVCVDDQDTATTSDDINYPEADISLMDGIMDTALNSLDGNRDEEAQGPMDYYDLNNPDIEDKDNFKWSFFINDQIKISPPAITVTDPENNTDDLIQPIEMEFDTLMMSDNLSTGSTLLSSGEEEVEHKLINIWNYSDSAIGYWVTKENIDSNGEGGWPDATLAYLEHAMLEESVTYRTQAGSGILDIYQNCFKPSAGPACDNNDPVSENYPSCCDGSAVQELDEDGNCPE